MLDFALKVIKNGADSAQIGARFEPERQTLALMGQWRQSQLFMETFDAA